MGTAYTRQSSFSDGDTITASLFNNEYDKLVEAFNSSTGHTHDGTAGEGAAITKVGPTQDVIISGTSVLPKTNNAIDLGSATYKFKNAFFAGNITADGSITYNGNVVLGSDSTDTITINGTIQGSSLVFEGATADAYELTLAIPDATADVTVTLPNATDTLVGRATTDTLTNKTITSPTINTPTITGNTTFSDGAYDFDIASHDGTNGLKLGGTLVTSSAAELNKLDGYTGSVTELNYLKSLYDTGVTSVEFDLLDGLTATTTELNVMDGGTTATSTTLADADRVVVNDAGTMKQVALTDFETYFESALDTLSNVTTVGALNSGSITSGFGAINNGSSNITTTGTVTYGSLSDGTITITAFVDEDNMVSDSATLVPTQQSVKAYVDSQVQSKDALSELSGTSDDITEGTTNLFFTSAEQTKLSNIEANADVTDATNVDAAGAVMNSDTTTASMSFVVDEDTMTSDSATKEPTQQSVKAYVDTQVAGVIDSAPATLDTLNELAAALNDDANFSTTVTTSIATKLAKASNLSDLADAATARTNLGLGTAATTASTAYATAAQGLLADSAVQNLSDLSITATSTEINYSSGVTSSIQTQIDNANSNSLALAIALG